LPPAPGLTVAVNGSGWLLSSNKILPMLGTLGRDCIPLADLGYPLGPAKAGWNPALRRRQQPRGICTKPAAE
jgi:hypothetical protein